MKFSKFKNLLLSSLLIFALFSVYIFEFKDEKKSFQQVQADYSVGQSYSNKTENSNNASLITDGDIPFSLFTSTKVGEGENTEYTITDYYPQFTATKNNTTGIYEYTMVDSSVPYFLLSSQASATNDILTPLYNTNLFFKFNDLYHFESTNSSTISNITLSTINLTLQTSAYENEIILSTTPDSIISTDNNTYTFALNLQELMLNGQNNPNVHCPIISSNGTGGDFGTTQDNYLGGNGEKNNVSARTGFYNLTITYNYKQGNYVSGTCVFKISFYVIDYSEYLKESMPMEFINTDTYTNEDSNEEIIEEYNFYNYNYEQAPIVKFDATKFALNFTYENNRNLYEINFQSFAISNNTDYTGIITLFSPQINKTYSFYTYENNDIKYEAHFDLQDFENNFILPNSDILKTSTFQGIYSFNLDVIVRTLNQDYVKVNKDLFNEQVEKNLTIQNLIIFGYDLRYQDLNTQSSTYLKELPLKNDYTNNVLYSYNSITKDNEINTNAGNYFYVPDSIPTTNQVPLKFHSYGNLSGIQNTAKYILLDVSTSESQLIEEFKTYTMNPTENGNEFDEFIDKETLLYTQSASITSNGIYLMKLDYSASIPMLYMGDNNEIYTKHTTVSGCQYVFFKINNSIESLYIQAVDTRNDIIYDFNSYTNKDILIGIEQKNNLFSVPFTVTYKFSALYNSTFDYSGTLSLKTKSDGSLDTYLKDGKTYNYYVVNQLSNVTFSNNGYYEVTISKSNSSYVKYNFNIDKHSFSNISVNSVISNNGIYMKSNAITPLSSTNEQIPTQFYLTNSSFTLGWENKLSNAKNYLYICYMELYKDNRDYSLLKQDNSNYYLTNGYSFYGAIKNDQSNYENSYNLSTLNSNNFFKSEGLYFFYLYDQAGNYSKIVVLLDNSLPAIAQGNWSETTEASLWNNTYDPINNPGNFVDRDTRLYFGSHKALKLPNLDEDVTIQIDDNSYKQGYNLNTGELIQKEKITFGFYETILKNLSEYVVYNSQNDLFSQTLNNGYYFILPNDNYDMLLPTDKTQPSGNIYVDIYTFGDYQLSGEATYLFSLQNANKLTSNKQIRMTTDYIKGTYFAYNDTNESFYIDNNSGTNLNVLGFEYTEHSGDLAIYYQVKSITYSYYPFALDSSDSNFSKTTYPFALNPTIDNENLVTYQDEVDGQIKHINNGINLTTKDNSDTIISKPGKYIITRTYVGGNYNFVNGQYIPTSDGTGGDYYYDETNDVYVHLFNYDLKVRQYVVYIDHNEIISSPTTSQDNSEKLVGNNINFTLNYNNSNSWIYRDFFYNNELTTNQVPVKINVPFSKYFIYDSTQPLGYLASTLDFAKLNVTINYTDKNNRLTTYIIDGYNKTTGLCTSSQLTSTNGELIFDAEGTYQIIISDNTGYVYNEQSNLNLNTNPTIFTYTFTIKYSSPSGDFYTNSYNQNTSSFIENKLQNFSNTFGTNLQVYSGLSSTKNQAYLKWNDDRTPYLSKISLIQVSIQTNNTTNYYNFVLNESTLKELAENNLCLVYNKNSQIVSKINKDNISQNDFLIYLKVNYYNQLFPSENFDGTEYYRYSYSLNFSLDEELSYDILLTYDNSTSSSYSFKQTNYTFNIDRTKPNQNIDKLIENESFLTTYYSSSLSSFKEENFNINNLDSIPSSISYSFGLNKNYVLSHYTDDTISYFYVRKYSKYFGEYPSITPDMLNSSIYQNSSNFARYPKFSETTLNNGIISIGSTTYYQITYSNTSLYNQLIKIYGENTSGYYEIIERDSAGNYRSYTVYFSPNNSNNYDILSIDGQDTEKLTFKPTSDSNLTASLKFTLTELYSKLGWGAVTVKNETLNSTFNQIIYLNPFKNLDSSLLNELNQFFVSQLDRRFSFTLSKYNSSFPTISKYVNIITNVNTAKLNPPEIVEVVDLQTNKTTYNLVLPTYSASSTLYLTSLTLKNYSTETKQWNTIYTYSTKEEVYLNNPIKNLQKGIYQVVYTDNYNKLPYSYNLYVGEYKINDTNIEYTFEYNKIQQNENTYYTGGNVQVTYEGNIYKVEVNGILYSGTNYEQTSPSLAKENCKTFTLTSNYTYDNIPANNSVGGNTRYIVRYYDITDNSLQKEVTFNIFNELPEITLLNYNDPSDEIASSLEESSSHITNSRVVIDFGMISDCDYDILNDSQDNQVTIATLYLKNSRGEYASPTIINRNYTVMEEGYYKLELKNSLLGNYRTIYFVIQFGDLPIYTITANNETLQYSKYEIFDLTSTSTNNLAYFNSSSSSSSILQVLFNALTSLKDDGFLLNQISTQTEYKTLTYHLGFDDEGNYILGQGNANVTNINHFYSIYDTQIIYNSNVDLKVIEFCFKNNILQNYYIVDSNSKNPTPENVGNDYWTTIYLVYDLSGPTIIKLFAITKTPENSNLLNQKLYYNQNSIINLTGANQSEIVLTNDNISGNSFNLSWNMLSTSQASTYWYNQGNYIYALDRYGTYIDYEILNNFLNSTSKQIYSTISNSGTHNLMFKDLAGNTHIFSNISNPNEYRIHILTEVIYNIRYQNKLYNPIQYGIFNDSLELVIDEFYLNNNYYSMRDVSISVSLNGINNTQYSQNNNVFLFTSPGTYKITIEGKYNNKSLNNAIYNFTIISTKSARIAFGFSEVKGYEILQVIKDGRDISENFMVNNKIAYLNINANDSKSGNGKYTITLKYGNRETDVLTFSFLISNYIPNISCSIPYGDSSKSDIVLSFNSEYIYSQLGQCYINILIYNSDSDVFYLFDRIDIDESNISTNNSYTLTEPYSYFIEVKTANGDTITSFRVTKVEPLNTFAIIAIVVGVLALIALIIVIIKLRTKMKIR